MNVSEIWSLLKHPRRNWKLRFFEYCFDLNQCRSILEGIERENENDKPKEEEIEEAS